LSLYDNRIINKMLGKDSEHEVPNRELLRYAVGIGGQNTAYGILSGWVKYFLMTAIGIDPILVGVVLMIPKIWDAINDPMVGAIIDKHTFKNGEKLRPFLLAMPIPIGIVGIFMFVDFKSDSLTLTLSTIAFLVFELMYSFQDIAQWGMTSLITTRPKERDRVAQIARIGATVGGLLPGAIPLILDATNGNPDPAHLQAPILQEKYTLLILAILFSLGGMCVSMLTHTAKERVKTRKVEGSAAAPIKLLLKNKIMMLVVASQIAESLTFNMDAAIFFKYMYSSFELIPGLRIEGMTMSIVFGIVCGIPTMFCMFFATRIARALGGFRNVMVVKAVMNLSIRLGAYLFGRFVGFQGYNIFILAAILSLAGLPSSLGGIAMTALGGDSLDYIEWKTGERNEATVFAMQNMTAKITGAISTGMNGLTMGLLAYDAKNFEGRNEALNYIPTLSAPFIKYSFEIFILAPAFGSLLCLVPLIFLKIDKKEKEQIAHDLAIRRGLAKSPEFEGAKLIGEPAIY